MIIISTVVITIRSIKDTHFWNIKKCLWNKGSIFNGRIKVLSNRKSLDQHILIANYSLTRKSMFQKYVSNITIPNTNNKM